MAFIHKLTKVTHPSGKVIGRGKGSGKGKNSGRGEAGQKKKAKVRAGFEGGQARLIQRLPFLRGKMFRGTGLVAQIVSLAQIEATFNDGEVVSVITLKKNGLITSARELTKILSGGMITKKVIVADTVKISAKAREKIQSVGGTVKEYSRPNTKH